LPHSDLAAQIEALESKLFYKQFHIDALLQITDAINRNLSAGNLFRIFEFDMRSMQWSRALLLHYDGDNWYEALCYGTEKHQVNAAELALYLSEFSDKYFQFSSDNYPTLLHSGFVGCIPVYHKTEPWAFLLVGGLPDNDPENIKFIQTLTNIIIVAIQNKRLFKQQLEQQSLKKELELAQRVQNMLVPKQLPHNKRLDMEAIYMPHHSIGGDYYDYVLLDNNEFIFCIADISGKGIAAALLMANIQAMLRALTGETNHLRELVVKLNKRILELTDGDRFITLFIAKHNLMTREFTYINAGHNAPLLCSNGKIEALDKGCTLLGVFDNLHNIQQTTLQLSPNTLLLAYTDGLTDLENDQNQTYSTELLANFMQQNFDLSMSDFSEELLQHIKRFKGSQPYTDDITIVNYRAF
jgi:sigma-B regulation protein RsbU (phosphoserine phosphatase)